MVGTLDDVIGRDVGTLDDVIGRDVGTLDDVIGRDVGTLDVPEGPRLKFEQHVWLLDVVVTLVFELEPVYTGLLLVLEVMGGAVVVTFVHSLAVTIIKLIRKNIEMNYTVRIKIEVAMQ